MKVTAKVLAHVRGEKLRVFKFKPKRGYKRRTGHRQELTQIEVTEIALAARGRSSRESARRAEGTPPSTAAKATSPAEAERREAPDGS